MGNLLDRNSCKADDGSNYKMGVVAEGAEEDNDASFAAGDIEMYHTKQWWLELFFFHMWEQVVVRY